MRKIKFSLKTEKDENGMLSILVVCTQFNKSIYFDTNVRIFTDEWDCENACIVNNPNAINLNRMIRKVVYQLEEYELDYNGDFTLTKLCELWECKESMHNFYALMSHQIEHRDIKDSTRSTHRNTLRHLKIYQPDCNIADLTEDYMKGFMRYMKGIKLNDSSIRSHMRTLRCYYNIACKLFGNKVPNGSFEFYHEKMSDRMIYKMKALTDEDIRNIENYVANPLTPEREVKRLEKFLFMSYTGVRISDFTSLTEENFTTENRITWLNYVSVKTETPVKIPISVIFDGRAEQLLIRHRNNLAEFFQIKDKPHFNIYINKYCHKAGINKHVTAHVARHTCASRLVNKDVPITTIQKIIGHRSLKMTMIYAKTSDSTLIRQLS